MRFAFVLLSVLLVGLGVAKLWALRDVEPAAEGILRPFGEPWMRGGIALLEVGAGVGLALTRSRWLVSWIVVCLAAAVLLHGADVLQRGSDALGCGCVGGVGRSTAGADLVRTSLVFALFAVGAIWPFQRSPGVPAAKLALLGLALGAALVFLPAGRKAAVPALVPTIETIADEPRDSELAITAREPPRRVEDASPFTSIPPVEPDAADPVQTALRVRTTHQGVPVVGAVITVRWLSSRDLSGPEARRSSGELGSSVFEAVDIEPPLELLVDPPAPLVPTGVVLDAIPGDEIEIALRAGAPLEVHTVGLDGSPMPG